MTLAHLLGRLLVIVGRNTGKEVMYCGNLRSWVSHNNVVVATKDKRQVILDYRYHLGVRRFKPYPGFLQDFLMLLVVHSEVASPKKRLPPTPSPKPEPMPPPIPFETGEPEAPTSRPPRFLSWEEDGLETSKYVRSTARGE